MLDQIMPTWLRWIIVACFALWLGYQLVDYGRDIEAKACIADRNAAAATTSEAHRQAEVTTTEKRTEAADEHIQAIKTLSAERDAAAASAAGLRIQLAAAIDRAKRAAPQDPSTQPGRSPIDAIGAALEACTAEYRAMGADAAERYAAGRQCEREYDALTAPQSTDTKSVTPEKGSDQ